MSSAHPCGRIIDPEELGVGGPGGRMSMMSPSTVFMLLVGNHNAKIILISMVSLIHTLISINAIVVP